MKILFLLLLTISFYTHAFEISPGISGSWYDKSNQGQGVNIEILDDNRMLVYWYSYDQGDPIWLTGLGIYQGNQATVSLSYFQGSNFGIDHIESLVSKQDFGEAIFTFENCNKGSMTYNSSIERFGSGTINLDRLTTIAGLSCNDEVNPPSPTAPPITSPAPEKVCTKDMLTLDKYIQISVGTSIDDANQIMGCEGELIFKGKVYRWQDRSDMADFLPAIELRFKWSVDNGLPVKGVSYVNYADEILKKGTNGISKYINDSNKFHEIGIQILSGKLTAIEILNGELVPVKCEPDKAVPFCVK